jgi:hypothetical protein
MAKASSKPASKKKNTKKQAKTTSPFAAWINQHK